MTARTTFRPRELNATPLAILPAQAEEALLENHPKPQYPPIARLAKVYGKVVLQAHIGTDGRVASLYVVDGPAMLQQAALDAVKNWTYGPYRENGVPMEVITTINVTFPKSLTR